MQKFIVLFSLLFFTSAFADQGDVYTVSHDDCKRAVKNIIEKVCNDYDNCKTTTLAEVRPTIMIKLSTLPGNNYASSCVNYIDTVYKNYQKRMTYIPTTNNLPFYEHTALSKTEYKNDNIFEVPVNFNPNISTCNQIYRCITDLASQRYAAEKEVVELYNKIISSDNINDTDLSILKTKSANLGKTMIQSALSPCSCTENITDEKEQQNYRNNMNATCDTKFTDDAKKALADYMNKNMWKQSDTNKKNTILPYLHALEKSCGIKGQN